METKDMQRDLEWVITAHQDYPRTEKKAYRKWDGRTPYSTHPIWCAMNILSETKLDEQTRLEGYKTLLYHDILEDTSRGLPDWLDERTRQQINEMTFQGGSSEEMERIWTKPKEIRLYKLYDKISNLMDGSWMTTDKRRAYIEYTRKLCEDVERNYGNLNITEIARAMIGFG